MPPAFPSYFPYLFPFFFTGMWILVTFLLSKKGWAALVANYPAEAVFPGTRKGIISASISGVNYKNSLVLKYNAEGFHLQPVWLFRLFHKPVLIPWNAIQEVRDKKIAFYTFKELVIGHPLVASIGLAGDVYAILEPFITKNKRGLPTK